MLQFVNAKINLGLNVVRRRSDGYHDLETVFYPVGIHSGTPYDNSRLADVLEIVPSSDDNVFFSGNRIDCPIEKNLVCKALELFKSNVEEKELTMPSFNIYLHKNIPDGAGMGGGSADASFTLKMLNILCSSIFTEKELLNMALNLGADCPFFILNRPVFAEGIGDKFSDVNLSLDGWYALIVKPNVYVSTAEAFSNITPHCPEINIRDILCLSPHDWKNYLSNDFEKSVFKSFPSLAQLKKRLYDSGAIYASMTGSGSAFFALYNSESDARRASHNFDDDMKYVVKL